MKKLIVFCSAIIIICAASLLCSKFFINEEVVKSKTDTSVNVANFKKMMAESINKREIEIVVDGNTYSEKNHELMMNDDLELMVELPDIPKLFGCAKNLYKDKLVIEKGATRVEIPRPGGRAFLNESQTNKQYEIVQYESKQYISVSVFTDFFNYEYKWDGSSYKATLMNLMPDDRKLPYYYSYEYENKAPKVRTQGNFGTCWAFASLTALESTLLPEENMVFSVDHMVLANSFGLGMYDGGDYNMSIAYLAAWQGPVLECLDEYDGVLQENDKTVKHVQEIQIIESKNYEKIKEMIYKYGGVQSSLYTSLVSSESVSTYYDRENAAYCYIGTNKPNHDVVIIGWDDNYSKENFSTDVEGNGAFICRNSWGENFGENGNFYVSYFDSNIGVHNIVYTEVEDTDNYDNIYQTDLCGWVGNMGYKDNNYAYFANVYTAKSDETVDAVGFYATDTDTSYEIYVVTDFESTDSLYDSRNFAGEGKLTNIGYYTVRTDGHFAVKKGHKFAVVVKAETPNSNKPVPIEYNNEDDRTSGVVIDDGEGYISLGGIRWENTEEKNKANVCLKAFTTITAKQNAEKTK